VHVSGTTTAPTAAWGDAGARRRDILEAAAVLLERGGYPALTMRAVAVGAGVSPGTIYHHFAAKEQVVAALMEERMDALRATIDGVPRENGVSGVLRAVVPEATELWRCIGRTSVGWAHDMLGPERDVRRTPAPADRAWHSLLDVLGAALAEAAAHDGRRVRGGAAAVPFVWAGLMGVADDIVNGWSRSAGLPDDELVEYSIVALARGVTEPTEGGP
jgi:AcrR family transcriptional regulator